MKLRWMLIISAMFITIMAALAGAAWRCLPPGTMLPVHWNSAGIADRMAPAAEALLMPICLAACLTVVLTVIPLIEPLQHRLNHSAPFYRTMWVTLMALLLLIEAMVSLPAFGLHLPDTTPLLGIGMLFLIMGNMLPKTRPGYFVGIRTPWTLSDPQNWIATHRLGGRTMMVGGAMVLGTALLPPHVRHPALLLSVAVAIVPPMLYSFIYWQRRQKSA